MATVLNRMAAEALDRTHEIGERGPKTYNARDRLAKYLDGKCIPKSQVKSDITWLFSVSTPQRPRRRE